MAIAKLLIMAGFGWGLSERSLVVWRSRRLTDVLLLAVAFDIAGLVLLSWWQE